MTRKSRADELAEAAEHVQSHDMAGVVDTAVWDTDVVAEPMVVTSIRLSRPLMQRVRAQADAAGVPATVLIRGCVEDRLVAQETGDAQPGSAGGGIAISAGRPGAVTGSLG